jgi:hypothetical protein
MGDENFAKYFVCLHYNWNPYSENIKNIPLHFWTISFYMLQMKPLISWKQTLEPHAELIGQLTHPDIYQQYSKLKKEIIEKEKQGLPKQASYTVGTKTITHAIADSHYDINKGLVDSDGKVIIPKERYEKLMNNGSSGIAVSY